MALKDPSEMSLEEAMMELQSLSGSGNIATTATMPSVLRPTGKEMTARGTTNEVINVPDYTAQQGIDVEKSISEDIGKKKAERTYGASNEALGSKRFLQQFNRSYDELTDKVPEIGTTGLKGWLLRKAGKALEKTDYLPETSAFLKRLKPMANQMARDVEGGRITDQDREIYADAFSNALESPTNTNIRLASESIISLADKGGDVTPILNSLSSTKSDLLNEISDQVYSSYPNFKRNSSSSNSGNDLASQARAILAQRASGGK